MRLARISYDGTARWGVLRDGAVHLIDGEPYGEPFGEYREDGVVLPERDAVLLPPVVPSKIIGLGRNYDAHRAEMGYAANQNPAIFMKPPQTLIGPHGTVVLPPRSLSTHVEHEAELAVVIGRPARFVSEVAALSYVLGYTCANDVSARDLQRVDTNSTRGKGFDTFCPVGPWIETELDLTPGVPVRCRVNGEPRQDGSTLDMISDVPFLISYLSQFTTLLPGDLLLTGSPGGSGPLNPGDRVEIEVGGIGVLHHSVAAADRD